MNILVTGGAGFIGSNLIRLLLEKYPDYKVLNLDSLTYAGNLENLSGLEVNPNYEFVKGDIVDPELVSTLLRKNSIDRVLHLAAESHVDRSILGPEEFLRTNIMGTQNLLACAKEYWGGEGKEKKFSDDNLFVNVSTDEVYGSLGAEGLFTEDSQYAPNSPYSASKAAADHLVRAYTHTYGLPTVTTHCSNNYGPYQFPEKLIPLMILNALAGKALPIYGDGKNVRDWIYVMDHARALDMVLHKGRSGEVYNVGASMEVTNIDLVQKLCGILDRLRPSSDGKPYEDLMKFVTDRPGHDMRYAIDSSKIERELGFKTEYVFEDALEKTVVWYLEKTAWSERILSGEYMDFYEKNYAERG
jgi:dTDP-glucose 4,6-dehydratase